MFSNLNLENEKQSKQLFIKNNLKPWHLKFFIKNNLKPWHLNSMKMTTKLFKAILNFKKKGVIFAQFLLPIIYRWSSPECINLGVVWPFFGSLGSFWENNC